MNQEEYDRFNKLADRELFDFVTEKDSSDRKWLALHLLELRRNREVVAASRSSARAAWLAAIIAGASAIVAVLAYVQAGAAT
jgi:hypothetical protein